MLCLHLMEKPLKSQLVLQTIGFDSVLVAWYQSHDAFSHPPEEDLSRLKHVEKVANMVQKCKGGNNVDDVAVQYYERVFKHVRAWASQDIEQLGNLCTCWSGLLSWPDYQVTRR